MVNRGFDSPHPHTGRFCEIIVTELFLFSCLQVFALAKLGLHSPRCVLMRPQAYPYVYMTTCQCRYWIFNPSRDTAFKCIYKKRSRTLSLVYGSVNPSARAYAEFALVLTN